MLTNRFVSNACFNASNVIESFYSFYFLCFLDRLLNPAFIIHLGVRRTAAMCYFTSTGKYHLQYIDMAFAYCQEANILISNTVDTHFIATVHGK